MTQKGKEAVMRLPVGKYGRITPKGLKNVDRRFFDGATGTYDRLAYALNIEAYSNGRELKEAIERYLMNIL